MSKQERNDKHFDANRSQDKDRHDGVRHQQRSDDSKKELKKDDMDKAKGGYSGQGNITQKNPQHPQHPQNPQNPRRPQ